MADVQGEQHLGLEILELIRTHGDDSRSLLDELAAIRTRSGQATFSRLLELLTGLGFDEAAAERSLAAVCEHRKELTRGLGRDPGLAIAAFDYFVNVDTRLQSPRMVEIAEFQEIERLAETDSLTGLSNRRRFRSLARRELRRSERYGQRASILYMDLDDFKEINDRWGHHCGDIVLREVARVLRQSLREVDLAARYGGEEFAVLLPETPRAGALVVAERIRVRVSERFATIEVDGRAMPMTISMGVAEYPEDAHDLDALLRRADEALYDAKSSGKNRVVAAFSERRRHARLDLPAGRMLPAQVIEPAAAAGDARAMNISRGGALLLAERPIAPGTPIRMQLAPPGDPRPPIALRGRVVRRGPGTGEPGRGWELGVSFQAADPGAGPDLDASGESGGAGEFGGTGATDRLEELLLGGTGRRGDGGTH